MEYWNRHANGEGMMSFEGFRTAWMEAEPGVEDRTIEEGWMLAHGQEAFDPTVWMNLDQFSYLIHYEDSNMERHHREGSKDADYWWNKYSTDDGTGNVGITMDGFIAGWREEDSNADEKQIVDTFHSANWDGDYMLNYDEFRALFTQMEQRQEQGREERDERGVDYWWSRFANMDAAPAYMDWDGFKMGMMEAEGSMSEDDIQYGWTMADQDMNGNLDFGEFERLFGMMQGRQNERRAEREGRGRHGDEGEDGMRGFEFNDGLPNARQIFMDFAKSEGGMNRDEYMNAYRTIQGEVNDQEMEDGWKMCDVDGSGMIDMQEFTECYRLYRHGREMHMYWVQFAIDQEAGLTMDEFHAGFKMA